MRSLDKKTFNASIWSVTGFGTQNVLRLIGNLILTRLLVPEMFGTMALIQAYITGLALFSDIGIGPSIIQNSRREEPVFYNTAWTIQVIRGVSLWIISSIVAYPIAQFYGKNSLLWLIPAVGINAFILGLQSTAIHLINRKMQLKKLIFISIVSQVLGLVFTISWALVSKSIWALVSGTIISSITKVILSHYVIKNHKNRIIWNRSAYKEIIYFGKWIFLSTATGFLAGQTDRMILGKLFTFEMLGIYTIAATLAEIPKQLVDQINSRVLFPFATYFSDSSIQGIKKNVLKKRSIIVIISAIILALIGFCGDWIIYLLYDERYHQGGWILPLLVLGVWPVILSSSLNSCLLAMGKPYYKAIGNSVQFVYMLMAIPILFKSGGYVGAVLAICFKDLPSYLSVLWGGQKEKLNCLFHDVFMTIIFFSFFIILLIIREMLGFVSPFQMILSKI